MPITITYRTEETVDRNINLTGKTFETFEDFYRLVAGRCNNAILHLTPDQTTNVYFLLASNDDWKEPNLLPADYCIANIRSIVVVED